MRTFRDYIKEKAKSENLSFDKMLEIAYTSSYFTQYHSSLDGEITDQIIPFLNDQLYFALKNSSENILIHNSDISPEQFMKDAKAYHNKTKLDIVYHKGFIEKSAYTYAKSHPSWIGSSTGAYYNDKLNMGIFKDWKDEVHTFVR